MASKEPASVSTMDKQVFADKWCTRFVALMKHVYDEGLENSKKSSAAVNTAVVDFSLEAMVRGLQLKDYGPDSSFRESEGSAIPWSEGFRFTNPFTAAMFALEFAGMLEERWDELAPTPAVASPKPTVASPKPAVASSKPVFGPAPTKTIFASHWCAKLQTLAFRTYSQGKKNARENLQRIDEYSAAFFAEASARGYGADDWKLPTNFRLVRPPSEGFLRFEHPFFSAMMLQKYFEEWKEDDGSEDEGDED